MSVSPIPAGYHSVTPYLVVADLAQLIGFLERAFGARVEERLEGPDGSPVHASLLIGNSHVMLGKDPGGKPARKPMLYLYVENVDEVFARAVEEGAEIVEPLEDQFYGDRSGGLLDPAGNEWWVATHIEELTSEELQSRMLKAQSSK